MKSKLIILLFAIICVVIVFNEDKPHKNQFTADAGGYYLYLPAVFIDHDLAKMGFYDRIDTQYNHPFDKSCTLSETGHKNYLLNKYPIGVSFFELPFFLLAHRYCILSHQYLSDGFSMPYQLAAIFTNIFWGVAGLVLLRRLLRRYFNDNVTALTILCIAFGTNFYVYNSFVIGMSHTYSFFLFSFLLITTDNLYTDASGHSRRSAVLLGLILGLIFLVRPVNLVVTVIPLFWLTGSMPAIRQRFRYLAKNYSLLFLALASCGMVAFLQLAYWKYATGSWLVYSYKGEHFDFLHPHIFRGLFSFRKGWFIYTPIALVGFWGLYYAVKRNAAIALPVIVFFAPAMYVVFSWQQWWYGGSFGCRPLIESLVVLSFPLAAAIRHFFSSAAKMKKTAFFLLLSGLVLLNIFQAYQYSMGLIHWDRMTSAYYFRVFGRTDFDRVKNEKYLLPVSEEYNFND